MRLYRGGLKRGITEVLNRYGKKRTKGGRLGEIGYYFPRRDTQAYRVLAVEAVSGEIPAELIYRLTCNPSFTETLIQQLKKGGRVYYRDNLRGEVMLKLRCNPDRRGELDCIRPQDWKAGESHRIIENDAVVENGDSVLFGYLLDIPRIHRFCNVLQIFKTQCCALFCTSTT